MLVFSNAAVTFIGNSNVMKSNTAPSNKGKSIYSASSNLKFTVCNLKPSTTAPGSFTGNLEVDLDGCPIELCTWHDVTDDGVATGTTGTHLVPAAGCKMSKMIDVRGDMTIKGVDGSYHELQANRVDKPEGTAISGAHRHFLLESPGELTLKFLKLTWGQTTLHLTGRGGFIEMKGGTLSINWVHFDGSKTTGSHASKGGCIYVYGGTVTIKKSTFEGFRAKYGGAMDVKKTTTAMTIESTTFKNNEATVRFIFAGLIKFIFFTSFFIFLIFFL